ncbi:MAG: SpoIIE family protein phosphatase [Micromonosporaceae bacterium]|nr:SpoIIE family protein phosphatase [Micromonosporaceae bacterium]
MTLFGFGSVAKSEAKPTAEPAVAIAHPAIVDELGWFDVSDSETAEAVRLAALNAGEEAGLDSTRLSEVSSSLTGLCGYLTAQPGGGWAGIRRLRRSGVGGLEIVLVDAGPGAAGIPGRGHAECFDEETQGPLAAAVRLATRHDGYSLPGRGTVITTQFWPRGVYPSTVAAAGLTRPMPGESVCGDRFAVILREDGPLLLVVDGLGHGPMAAEAAQAAVASFYAVSTDNPADVLEEVHTAIAGTRGAAVAIAKLEPSIGVVRFAGLGNIAAAAVCAPTAPGQEGHSEDGHRPGRIGMLSHAGIAGHQRGEVYECCYPIRAGDLVVLHSDGLTDRWDLAAYPGLACHEPLVVAAALLRDAGVRQDDACVLVARSY